MPSTHLFYTYLWAYVICHASMWCWGHSSFKKMAVSVVPRVYELLGRTEIKPTTAVYTGESRGHLNTSLTERDNETNTKISIGHFGMI